MNKIIFRHVCKNDPITIRRETIQPQDRPAFDVFNLHHATGVVGQLSSNSNIAKQMKSNNINVLEGFFVCDVFNWSYEDTVKTDKNKENKTGKNPNYALGWCLEAKRIGHILIVDIAGYGTIVE